MPAGTNHLWRPGLKGRIPDSLVPDGKASVYEIVLDGIDETSIRHATKTGIEAATEMGAVMYTVASILTGNPASILFTFTTFSANPLPGPRTALLRERAVRFRPEFAGIE